MHVSGLKSVRNELLSFIATIDMQSLLNMVLERHKNLSISEHQQLYKILQSANKRQKPGTLLSLGSVYLSHILTFLTKTDCIPFKKTCTQFHNLCATKKQNLNDGNDTGVAIKQEPLHDHYKGNASSKIDKSRQSPIKAEPSDIHYEHRVLTEIGGNEVEYLREVKDVNEENYFHPFHDHLIEKHLHSQQQNEDYSMDDIDIINDNVNDGVIRILSDDINIKFCPKCKAKVTRTDKDIKNSCSVMTCIHCGDDNDLTYWCWECSAIINAEDLSFNPITNEPGGACRNCRKLSRKRRNCRSKRQQSLY